MRLLEIFNERLREECHLYGNLSTSKKPISLGVSDYMRSNKLEKLSTLDDMGARMVQASQTIQVFAPPPKRPQIIYQSTPHFIHQSHERQGQEAQNARLQRGCQ